MNLVKMVQLPLFWILVLVFIAFYPMLISIYVFLPLLVGVMGFLLMKGVEKNNPFYILVALVYLINLEVNLSLPFFLTVVASLIVYLAFYSHQNYFKKCVVCKSVLSVIMIDLLYLGLLLSYDFVFQTNSIVVDQILVYSLVIDLLVVVLF